MASWRDGSPAVLVCNVVVRMEPVCWGVRALALVDRNDAEASAEMAQIGDAC